MLASQLDDECQACFLGGVSNRGPASPMPSHVPAQRIRVTLLPTVRLCSHLFPCRPFPARGPRASSCWQPPHRVRASALA
eukprot:10899762-Heterocapsa_arctica.AAC.1